MRSRAGPQLVMIWTTDVTSGSQRLEGAVCWGSHVAVFGQAVLREAWLQLEDLGRGDCAVLPMLYRAEEILHLLPPVGLEVFHLQPDEPACRLVVRHPDAGLQ